MRNPHPTFLLTLLLGLSSAAADEGDRAPGEHLATSSHTIQEIQGAGHTSPLAGTDAVDVVGVVTGVSGRSFTFQAGPDGNAGTSDALMVYVGNGFEGMPAVGDEVAVSGRVTEWATRLRGEEVPGARTQTQLAGRVKVRVLASAVALPEATAVGASGRMPPVEAIDPAHLKSWDPAKHALDYWESLEHMRVVLNDALVVGPTKYGSFYVVPEGGQGYPRRTTRGGVLHANQAAQPCPSLVEVDGQSGVQTPDLGVGDRVPRLEGVITPGPYTSARLLVPAVEAWTPATWERKPTTLTSDGEHLTVASFNVQNFSAAVKPERAKTLARGVVDDLRSPAIVALQEVQDDDGPGQEGDPAHDGDLTTAAATYGLLCDAIEARGGPRYSWVDIPPTARQEGGQPGGNIRVGFLFDPQRVRFERRGEAGSQVPNRVESKDGEARLAFNPGRVAPQDPSFVDTRRTLAAEFLFNGHRVVVVNSHFSSRRRDEPAFGPNQPPVLHSEPNRIGQATAVGAFLAELAEKGPQVTIVALGDYNEFHFRPALKRMAGDALEILTHRLPPAEAYSYVFQGTSQPLDHALLGGPLKGQAEGVHVEYLHVNADFPGRSQTSDHDPLVVRLHLP